MQEIDEIIDTLDINTKRLLAIRTESYKKLSDYDLGQQDLLHLIEFEEPKFHDCLDIITELKRLRQKRRVIKDNIEKINNILSCLKKTEFVKEKVQFDNKFIKHRKYTNRIYKDFNINDFVLIKK